MKTNKLFAGVLSALMIMGVAFAAPAQPVRTQPASAADTSDKVQPADTSAPAKATDTTTAPVESNPAAPTAGPVQPEPTVDPYPSCPHRYYLTLQFGDDFAFSPRDDRNQADQIGYKCADGSWHFIFIGIPQ